MAVYEHDDQGLRVIGYNHGIFFYDPTRTLQCEVFLRPDNTLSICGASVASGLTQAGADTLYVRLDGNNWASWLPSGGTQSVVGSFNLQGAAYQYKISGRHALSMPGTNNLLAGDGAGAALTASGTDNVIIGYQAGLTPTAIDDFVIIGSGAGKNLFNDYQSVVIGSNAVGSGETSLDDSIVIGYYAAEAVSDTIDDSTIIGSSACATATVVTASIVMGTHAGYDGALINDAVIIGRDAVDTSITRWEASVAIGALAAAKWADGYGNVAIGMQAGETADGDYNVYIGMLAGSTSTGNDNVAVGYNADAGSGHDNVVVGSGAGGAVATGASNVVVGMSAGAALTTGTDNVLVGFGSGVALTTGASNVFVGFQSGFYETGSNKLFIDNAKRTNEADARVKALIYGVFDAATANQHLTFNSHLHYGGGPGYALHQSYSAVDNVGVTVIADAAGDVTATVTFMYAVYAVTGTDSTGGVVTLEPGDSFVLYNDGTDVLTITVSAGGAVTVARTAGADTFNVALQGVWL